MVSNSKNPTETIGPITIDIPALAAGDSHTINLRQRERNGRKGWFRPYLPMDSLQLTNQSAVDLEVSVNGTFSDLVVSNAVESYDDAGVVSLTVTNLSGSTSTSGGEVTAAVSRTPYDADDAAREQLGRSQASQIIEKFTGVQL